MIRYIFFDKSCVIDRALADRSGIDAALKNLKIKHDAVLFLNQIHSAEVCVIDHPSKIYGVQNLPKADAIITNLPNLALAVITADCAPILLQDNNAKIIAAIHAGWRGAKLGIIAATIKQMQKLGADKSRIRADLGPLIHQKSYQVSADFFDDFIKDAQENKKFFINDKSSSGHYLFDLPAFVKEKLQQQDIKEIHDVKIDTYVEYDKYASYRKATHLGVANDSRNISMIVQEDGA